MSSDNGPAATPVPLAIIGVGCLFPKAPDARAYWLNIKNRVDAIGPVPSSHWDPDDYLDPDPKAPDRTYAARGGFLDPVDFRPLDFGIAPNDLEATDTSQLLGLVAARQALLDAGYGPERDFDRNRVSVLLGVTGTLELVIPLGARLGHPRWRKALLNAGIVPETAERIIAEISDSYVGWQENSFPGLLGNVVAGRIANRLDLGGTNCVVDAACASSLSAVHLAGLELAAGRCDVAVTGGVDTFNDIFMFMCFSKTPALSPSGDARPFDAKGDGTILGEGLGMIVLKRLADAERDGDRIYAVIRSIGASSDGKGNAIYAPSSAGQMKALRTAYSLAGVGPHTVELVEAHGTGTRVGDAAEVAALTEVYREAQAEGTWCGLGSVKSQIGHTKAAAGAAGLIKAAFALHKQVMPPTLKVDEPIEALRPGQSPFAVNTQKRPWVSRPEHPRRAAVSAFGFGGSNFHCVLEEHSSTSSAPDWEGEVEIIALGADDASGLNTHLDGWRQARSWPQIQQAAAESRRRFSTGASSRLFLVAGRSTDLPKLVDPARTKLNSEPGARFWRLPEGAYYGSGPAAGRLAVLFPGQGSQYVGMLRDLACSFPQFRDVLSDANRVFDRMTPSRNKERLSDLIYPFAAFSKEERELHEQRLRDTQVAQPAIGATAIGALKVLELFGLNPDAYAGHSYGELPALCAAGCFDADALHTMSRLRGHLMASYRGGDAGSMLAVHAPLATIETVLREESLELVVANRNAPGQSVLSGRTAEIDRAISLLERRKVRSTKLAVAAAFHSPLVASAQRPFRDALSELTFHAARKPVYANTSAREYPSDPVAMRELLAGQLAHPVDFVREVGAMAEGGVRTFLEVGPGSTLTKLASSILGAPDNAHLGGWDAFAVDASSGKRSGILDLAHALARLAARGHAIDLRPWQELDPRDRVPATDSRPGLVIPIGGANYVQPKKKGDATAAPAPKPSSGQLGNPPGRRDQPESVPAIAPDSPPSPANRPMLVPRTAPAPAVANLIETRPVDPPSDAGALSQALQVTQQSLAAFAKLQEQTAQLHRQFLENQEAAQRTLQMLVEQQHALLTGSLPAAVHSETSHVPAAQTHSPRHAESPQPAPPRQSAAPGTLRNGSSHHANEAPPLPKQVVAAGPPASDVSRILLAVVAEKTGYPAEMLAPEMALDADLGIDSIKRVEIFSALQERLPDAPAVKPEHLGTLHTLRDVIDFLGSVPALPKSETGVTGPPSAKAPVDDGRARSMLLAVVAEKTGYPAEMLAPEMALDADLGIDSIKRVEIFSALQERLPDAPAVKPEHLGSLHTLRDVIDFLSAGTTQPMPPASGQSRDQREDRPRAGVPAGIQNSLFQIISEKTGYPAEMLMPEMALDADLGIDSIKRVEIFSALQERLPDAPIVKPEDLGSLHRLGDIVEFLSGNALASQPEASRHAASSGLPIAAGQRSEISRHLETNGHPTPAVQGSETAESPPSKIDGTASRVERSVLRVVPLRRSSGAIENIKLAARQTIVLVADSAPLATELVRCIERDDCRVLIFGWDQVPAKIVEASGLILLAPQGRKIDDLPLQGFRWLRQTGASIRRAAGAGTAIIVSVTQLGGSFGVADFDAKSDPRHGALAGLVKTAAREWPEVVCKAIDIASGDASANAANIWEEALRRGPLEVGISRAGATAMELVSEPLNRQDSEQPLVAADDVVLITGGARGVTAAVACAVAERFHPTIVVMGRTMVDKTEPGWLKGCHSEAEIKQELARRLPPPVSPKKVDEEYRRVAAQREALANIRAMEEAGAKVIYKCLDIADRRAVAGAVRDLPAPVTYVIHGAGVLADRRIEDLTDEQFQAVYTTKVAGLESLLEALRGTDLKGLVLFSSSTGRFGRAGQAAYAAANEALNKIAQQQARLRRNCKVASINWGPWDGGMVTPALRAIFAAEGVGVIPLQRGAEVLIQELAAEKSTVEITVIARPAIPAKPLQLAFEQPVSLRDQPLLRSHVIDGRAVLPLAIHLEWLVQAALHGNPGCLFHGVDDLRLLHGVTLSGAEEIALEALAGAPIRRDGCIVVPVELRGRRGAKEIVHSRAEVVLVQRLPAAPEASVLPELQRCAYSAADAYEQFLFHGPALAGIEKIEGIGSEAIAAVCRTAPPPAHWLRQPLRGTWTTDPLVVDSAFQAMILWSFAERGAGSLPCFVGGYRQYRRQFPAGPINVGCRITGGSASLVRADIDFTDASGNLVARIEKCECVIDENLQNAFRRNQVHELTAAEAGGTR